MKLPADWQSFHAAALAEELFESLPAQPLQNHCPHCLIAASLQMLWGTFWKNRNPLVTVGLLHWRAGQLEYKCLKAVTDDEIEDCKRLAHLGSNLAIIPPRAARVSYARLSGRCRNCDLPA